ncbi:hypothetical protein D3C87_856320 [compost metagenome]
MGLAAQRLDACAGALRAAGHLGGECDGLGQRAALVGQAVHRAHRVQALGREAVAGEAQLGEQLARDELREEGRGAAVGREADLDVGHRVERIARRHQHVAGQRHRQARAGRAAFDGRDHGLAAVADRADQVVQAFELLAAFRLGQFAALGQQVQVAARAEEVARAGEDDGAHLGVVLRVGERGRQLGVQRRRDRVARGRVAVGQDADGAFLRDEDGLVRHAATSLPRAM